MLKYASKLFVDFFFLFRLRSSALTWRTTTSQARLLKATVPVVGTAVDPKGAGIAVSREVVQMEATASEVSLDVVNAIGPVASASGRTAEHANDEKTVPPTTKLAEPTCVPARHLPRAARQARLEDQRDRHPLIPSKIGAAPEPARTTTERMLSLSVNSSVDAPPSPPGS
jgi:hypothetical protein